MILEIGGKAVHATTGGAGVDDPRGSVVLLVHGAGMDRTVWQFQTRYLASHGFVPLALDLPGHGESEGPAPTSISGYAAWLADVAGALGRGPVHAVGHSMGALAVLELAAAFPDRVTSISLLGVGDRMPVHPELLDAASGDDPLATGLITGWSHGRAAHTGAHSAPGMWMMGGTSRMLERSRAGVLASGLRACDTYVGAPSAAALVGVPALVLVGERDVMIRRAATLALADAIDGATVVDIDGAGHLMMIERPDAVIEALASFLGTLASDEPGRSRSA